MTPTDKTSPYRNPSLPEPLPPDPDIENYAARTKAQRRRVQFVVIAVASAGALIVVALVGIRALRERRLVHTWRDALACFDSGAVDGFDDRIRSRELRALDDGDDERSAAWPSRCAGRLWDVVDAAEVSGEHVLATTASEVAEIAERWDHRHEDIVFPAWRMFASERHSALPTAQAGQAPPAPIRFSRVNELDRLEPRGVCAFGEDGRSATCGLLEPRDGWSVGQALVRRFDSAGSHGSAYVLPPPRERAERPERAEDAFSDAFPADELAIEACDADGCFMEAAGIGERPPAVAAARLGTKIVLVWIDGGAVGGVRMRLAERGGVATAKTRVILDNWMPWPLGADDGAHPRGFAVTPVRRLHVVARPDHALVFFEAQNVFVARIDLDGAVTRVPISPGGPLAPLD